MHFFFPFISSVTFIKIWTCINIHGLVIIRKTTSSKSINQICTYTDKHRTSSNKSRREHVNERKESRKRRGKTEWRTFSPPIAYRSTCLHGIYLFHSLFIVSLCAEVVARLNCPRRFFHRKQYFITVTRSRRGIMDDTWHD